MPSIPALPKPLGPDDVQVLLIGGPCNGLVRVITVKQADVGVLSCSGATYVPDPRDTNYPPQAPYPTPERWVPDWQAASINAGHIPAVAKNVGVAWGRLMRVFAHTAPLEIRRLRAATSRMDRLAYKLRKVR
jgi:hypothetical protein